ncbi:cytochrome P450 [Deinococcus sp. QL22]|uniref:cytochrome P450 n=1 Tax=Deinococcus sp. QL22 TaxID=2939437 RepID=UPI002017F16D|nr:cytochrome P450 [Deinococcus sp. QL22]UQN09917.1 cytochrome P450 [Deinococcus sp. QL22]
MQRNLLSLDGADHDRLKVLVHEAFTPCRVEGMRDITQSVTDAALDRAQRLGLLDLVADFARPVPLTIIGRILGVPEQDDATFNLGMKAFVAMGGSPNPPLLAFVGYLRKLIKTRRARSGDDLISALMQAQDSPDHLTDDEIPAMVFLLLSAGHKTTVNLIGSGVLALLQHPEQLARLRADSSLLKSGIEELVRFVVPAETATERHAAEDVTIAGTRIPKGELVLAVIVSANRDPTVFQDPDSLDVGRQNNKHLSFGQGLHYCLGAPLSRLEAQIAIGTLLRRAPNLRLAAPPSGLQ